MQHAHPGDGGEEDDGARRFVSYHGPSARGGNEERAREVDVEEFAEERWRVGFCFDVGTNPPSVHPYCLFCEPEKRPYSTTPAELIRIFGGPRSEVTLATTSSMAFSSRTSTL